MKKIFANVSASLFVVMLLAVAGCSCGHKTRTAWTCAKHPAVVAVSQGACGQCSAPLQKAVYVEETHAKCGQCGSTTCHHNR